MKYDFIVIYLLTKIVPALINLQKNSGVNLNGNLPCKSITPLSEKLFINLAEKT